MQNVIDSFLASLATVLAPLSPFAKAVVPASLGLATAIVAAIVALVTHQALNVIALTSAGTAEILAVVVYFTTNKPKPAPAPARPVVK